MSKIRSGFGVVPTVRYRRNKFNLSHSVKTSMEVGRLYPLDLMEVYAGDTFKTSNVLVSRVTNAFTKPVLDNLFLDTYSFFVPFRAICDYTERVFANPNPSAYTQDNRLSFPATDIVSTITKYTVGDYLGLPVGQIPRGLSVMPFRAFALVYEKYFRNQNVEDEIFVQRGEFKTSERPNNNAWAPNNYTGQLPFVNKHKDYFTTCLPQPQKGPSIKVPVGERVPVSTSYDSSMTPQTIALQNSRGDDFSGTLGARSGFMEGSSGTFTSDTSIYQQWYVDLANATGVSVSDWRLAFQLQKMLELDARAGSRIDEYYSAHFGTKGSDSRWQYPEFLGGSSTPINVQQVAQTSVTASSSPLGNVAGYSLSNGKHRYVKSFVEHGYILTVGCLRAVHTYSQGVPRLWHRIDREQFYDPLFSHLSEQPVYRAEIFASSSTSFDQTVFGYQEAFAELRCLPNRASGDMRVTNGTTSGNVWTFGDYFSSAPVLGSTFMHESSTNVARTIYTSVAHCQFLVDLYSNCEATRVLDLYGTPGFIDH